MVLKSTISAKQHDLPAVNFFAYTARTCRSAHWAETAKADTVEPDQVRTCEGKQGDHCHPAATDPFSVKPLREGVAGCELAAETAVVCAVGKLSCWPLPSCIDEIRSKPVYAGGIPVALAIFQMRTATGAFCACVAARVCPTPDKQLNFIGACYV